MDIHSGRARILFLVTHGAMGGAQTHIFHLATHIARSFEVHAAMGERGLLWDKLSDAGIPVYGIPSLVRQVSPVADCKGLVNLIRLFKTVKPDLIAAHSSKAGILGRLAARLCKIPVVFTAHGWAFTDGVPSGKKKIYLIAERIAARWASMIICVSEYDCKLARAFNPDRDEKLVTIHNGIPRGTEKHLASPGSGDPVRLIMVARFSDPKDHRLLLKAISQIHTGKAFQVELVGGGPLLGRCMDLAKSLEIGHRVKFLGERADVPELLARSHIFVLVSRWEGFPISVLEAMRAGLPVVASDVGGTGESVVDGDTGFLIPRDDVEMLRSRMLTLINDPGLRARMGVSGRNRFLEKFTLDKMLEKTVKIYSGVMPGINGGITSGEEQWIGKTAF